MTEPDVPLKTARKAIPSNKPEPLGTVSIRVTALGHGKVAKGVYQTGIGDLMHEKGDVLMVPQDTAYSLEARGLAEIQ